MCIRTAVIIGLAIVVSLTVSFASPGLAVGLIIIANLLIGWFYGAVFETFMNGQTPGKHVLGMRVLTDTGQPIKWHAGDTRNPAPHGRFISAARLALCDFAQSPIPAAGPL